MLEFTEPMSNVNLNSWPCYRNPLSRGITMTFPLVRHKVTVWPEGIPLGGAGFAPCSCCCQSVVYSLRHLLLEVLSCHSFPQHVLPCWTPAPLQFLLARACAFTAVVLCSHAIFFFPCLPTPCSGRITIKAYSWRHRHTNESRRKSKKELWTTWEHG